MAKITATDIPRLLVAGTESGVGKTTLVTGLLGLWRRQGLRVQPYKVGPDYIDPSFHTFAAQRSSRNLDTWLCSKRQVLALFASCSSAADLSVIEGVMGFYDGFSPTAETGSSAEVAKLLQAPVVLVMNGKKLARSAAAIVLGFQKLDPKVDFAGVIFNNVGSERHYELLRRAVEKECRLPCLGYLTSDPKLVLPEQHLGLVPVESVGEPLQEQLDYLIKVIGEKIDHAKLLRIANAVPKLPVSSQEPPRRVEGFSGEARCRIGYARDEAFHFYYPDNVELLESLGAEMVPFSPLRDTQLPDVDSLYFGGGFPENFAAQLAANQPMKVSVRGAIEAGMPTYAECGGLMYLVEELQQKDGKKSAMVGAIPGRVVMTERLQNFGYHVVEAQRDSLLLRRGERSRGHEFHYSRWEAPQNQAGRTATYRVWKRKGDAPRSEGFAEGNLLASYVHLHFLRSPKAAARWVARAVQFAEKGEKVSS